MVEAIKFHCNYQSLGFKSGWKFELVPYYQLQVVSPDADMCCTRQMKLKLTSTGFQLQQEVIH